MTRYRRSAGEHGTVAVVVAICSVLIFSIAALAVDLGNAMVRKRDVQSQADLAALAGAPKLGESNTKSATDEAVMAVAKYLNENRPQDDAHGGPAPDVTAAQLVDGGNSPYPAGIANGEIYFLPDYRMRVVSPFARVDFGLADVMGFSNVDVQADATVGLVSPGPVVPFFLPKDCAAGSVTLKAGSYNPKAPTFDPASANGGGIAQIDSLDKLTVPGGAASTLRIYGSGFSATLTVDFFHEGSGDRTPVDVTQGHPATFASDGDPDEATVILPSKVFNTPGVWYMRVNNGLGYSKTAATFQVGDPAAPPVGCGQRSTGDFGVIDSPRKDVTQLAEASALNMAEGLDHDVVPFDTSIYALPPAKQDTCNGNGGTPPPGAKNDTASVDGNNCLDVKNGMNTDTVTDGMILGGTAAGGYQGRLRKDTTTGCDRNGGSDEAILIGESINDDVLSCFLKAGVSVGEVSSETISADAEESIDADIYDSPRFMVVPVIDYPINPQNGFYPIVGYVPAFITDEPPASENVASGGTSYATSSNGVIIHSNKVVSLSVVAINPKALPDTADVTSGTVPYTGSGTKVIRLLE